MGCWVVKIPKHPEFCGRPPCGLCYIYVEDNGVEEQRVINDPLNQGIYHSRVVHDYIPPTKEQIMAKKLSSVMPSEARLEELRKETLDELLAKGEEVAKEVDSLQRTERSINNLLKTLRNAKPIKPVVYRRPLDDFTEEEILGTAARPEEAVPVDEIELRRQRAIKAAKEAAQREYEKHMAK